MKMTACCLSWYTVEEVAYSLSKLDDDDDDDVEEEVDIVPYTHSFGRVTYASLPPRIINKAVDDSDTDEDAAAAAGDDNDVHDDNGKVGTGLHLSFCPTSSSPGCRFNPCCCVGYKRIPVLLAYLPLHGPTDSRSSMQSTDNE
jgi:hypothetical protein